MKTLIIGNLGSGKTTLAEKIGKMYEIPFFSIDNIVHDDIKGVKRTNQEQIDIINKINRENKDYIIEGVLRENLEFLCNLVDTIIILDMDKKILKKRIKKRYLKQKMGLDKVTYVVNKDMLNKMYGWMECYDYERMNRLHMKYFRKVILLKSDLEIKKYLLALEKNYFNYF